MSPRNARVDSVAELRVCELAAVGLDGRIEFKIQRLLKNYNSRNRHAHWSTKDKGRKVWQASMCNALVYAVGMARAQRLLAPSSGLFGARAEPVTERRRLEITRLVPSRRQFVKDTFENLPWTAKELRDAIKNCGLVRDDSAKWTETVITQELSLDGTAWTWIAISRADA